MLFSDPLSAPIPNITQIGQKTQKLEIFTFGWFWLVGLVGRKMVGDISNFCPVTSPHTKFYPNRMRNTEVENFCYWSILVGRAGKAKNNRSHFKNQTSIRKVIDDLCTNDLSMSSQARIIDRRRKKKRRFLHYWHSNLHNENTFHFISTTCACDDVERYWLNCCIISGSILKFGLSFPCHFIP